MVDKTDSGFNVVMGSHKLVVSAKPLKIDFYSNGELVVSANARGLLKFEQYRQRKEHVEGEQVKTKIKNSAKGSFTLLRFPRASAADGCVSAGR